MRRLVAKVHARNNDEGDGKNIFMRTIELNHRIFARLKLATPYQNVSDASLAKEEQSHIEKIRCVGRRAGEQKRRGQGRKKTENARALSKGQFSALRAELR